MQLLGKLASILKRGRKSFSPPAAVTPPLIQAASNQHENGDIAKKEGIFRQILAEDPNNAKALQVLGVIAQQRGDDNLAIALLTQAVSISPNPAAYNSLGIIHRRKNEIHAAESYFRKALALQPDYLLALNNLGTLFQEQGEPAKAEEMFHAALAQAPRAETYTNLGNIYMDRGELENAERFFQLALDIRPEYSHAHNALGLIYLKRNEPYLAERCFLNALASNPNMVEANSNMGEALRLQGRLEDAETCCRRALLVNPEHVDAYINLSLVLSERGFMDEAESCSRKALALRPDDPTLGWNLALLLLLQGNYEEGLSLYEKRLERSHPLSTGGSAAYQHFRQFPCWRGEHLEGKRILIWTEQGLGDTLMVLRFLPHLKQAGAAQLHVYCPPVLQRLIETIPEVGIVFPSTHLPSDSAFDLHCPSMSLPFLLGSHFGSIPNQVPYVFVPKQLATEWTSRISPSVFNIGLAWAGSRIFQNDGKRSIPLHLFEPLLGVENIRLFSLQKDESAVQLKELGWDILDFMDDCQDMLDTAALVENLDLVISVDTAVAHLAGALGKPVWLLNRHESEWRWGLKREDSPWYPSMRIFRQIRPSDWSEVIQRVTRELTKTLSHTP